MTLNEAFERRDGDGDAPILITCEHATQRMPDGWSWPEADRRLLDTHWAYDLGALELATDLAGATGATELSTRFTRLLIDPNRPETSDTLFRATAEGAPVALNTTHLDDADRERRITRFLRPYHAAVDAAVASSRAPVLVSMHTFTRHYEGSWRDLDVGVLYDLDEDVAAPIAESLKKRGLNVELNAPYSGKAGLMYAVDRHARAHGKKCVEFEVRQDLATYRGFREDFGALLAETMRDVARVTAPRGPR